MTFPGWHPLNSVISRCLANELKRFWKWWYNVYVNWKLQRTALKWYYDMKTWHKASLFSVDLYLCCNGISSQTSIELHQHIKWQLIWVLLFFSIYFCYIEMGETIDQALSTLFLNEPQSDIPLSLSFQSCYR